MPELPTWVLNISEKYQIAQKDATLLKENL
jgi:hypothetical protein